MKFYSFAEVILKSKCTGSSEFSNHETELQNRITQNEVTLPVTNSKIFAEILLSSY